MVPVGRAARARSASAGEHRLDPSQTSVVRALIEECSLCSFPGRPETLQQEERERTGNEDIQEKRGGIYIHTHIHTQAHLC